MLRPPELNTRNRSKPVCRVAGGLSVAVATLLWACPAIADGSPSASTLPNAGLTIDPPVNPHAKAETEMLLKHPGADTALQQPIDVQLNDTTNDGRIDTPWYRNGVASLAIVLGLILAAAWAFKRWAKPVQVVGADLLKVHARTHLSPKQSIALVQMGGRFAFVGITPDNISPLRVVEDPEEAANLRTELRLKRSKQSNGFEKTLHQETETVTRHLEPAMPSSARSYDRLATARQDVRGLLQKLRNLSEEKQSTESRLRTAEEARTG